MSFSSIAVQQPTLSIAVKNILTQKWSVAAQRFPVHRIYCVGRNYRDHAVEMGADPDREPPFFFQKPHDAATDVSTSNREHILSVPYPPITKIFHYEAELVVAIGKGGLNIPPNDVPSHIFGYSIGCDLTCRDLQAEAKRDGKPWCSSKGFDFSAPCAAIVPKEELDLLMSPNNNARISLEVNGQLKQDSTLDKMTWSIPEAISILSHSYYLKPGDLIFTGTPAGVGPLEVGDVVRITCGDLLPECVFQIGPVQT